MWHWCLRASHERACCRCHACCRLAPGDAPPTAATRPTATPGRAAVDAVFPSAVSSKYWNELRRQGPDVHGLDQYNANKAGNGNGGLKWIEKGGGYVP